MDSLRKLLQQEKIPVQDLETKVRSLGFDPQNLTDSQVEAVFEKLKLESKNDKLQKSHSGAIAKHDAISPVDSLKTDLGRGLREVNAELDQMTATVQEVVDTVVETKAQSMFSLIKSIPQLTSGRVKQLIETSNGDMTFFRQSPADLKASLLSEFGIK